MNRKPFTIARIVTLVLAIIISAPGPVIQAQWSQGSSVMSELGTRSFFLLYSGGLAP